MKEQKTEEVKEEKKVKNNVKRNIAIVLALLVAIGGYGYYDYNESEKALGKELKQVNAKTSAVFVLSEESESESCCHCDECTLAKAQEEKSRASFDKAAKAEALQKLVDEGKYGEYSWKDSNGEEQVASRNKPASNSSSGGYSGGGSGYYSGSYDVESDVVVQDWGNHCRNCDNVFYGTGRCPYCGW